MPSCGMRVARFGSKFMGFPSCWEHFPIPKPRLMLSSPAPTESTDAATLRGEIFSGLDRLAFALEMEAAEHVLNGRDEDADRTQATRLGVRLAQRLVSGVWADEVNLRLQRWETEYERRLAPVGT